MPRILGIDLGARRIGIAISDDKGKVATPYVVMPRTSDEADVRAILEIASGEGCKQLILGYPLALDGSVGDAALLTESFAGKLKEAGARVKLWDERLTTKEASKKLTGTGLKARKQRALIDKHAAAVLLQSFLDSKK